MNIRSSNSSLSSASKPISSPSLKTIKPRLKKIHVDLNPSQHSLETQFELVHDLRRIAMHCFTPLVEYQCLITDASGLKDKVIAVAYDQNQTAIAFCSAIWIQVPQCSDRALHLGLTCVDPSARGLGLTHKLTHQLLSKVLRSYSPFKKLWISNVACVLSSLGNVALHFKEIYPSPFCPQPTETHLKIARILSDQYRKDLAISPTAFFDEVHFVFRGSVYKTAFQKEEHYPRYQHRNEYLNTFYKNLLQFDQGDEACQIGWISWGAIIEYSFKSMYKKFKKNFKKKVFRTKTQLNELTSNLKTFYSAFK